VSVFTINVILGDYICKSSDNIFEPGSMKLFIGMWRTLDQSHCNCQLQCVTFTYTALTNQCLLTVSACTNGAVYLCQCRCHLDENETEGTESDDKETVTYSVSSEVKFLNAKATRYDSSFTVVSSNFEMTFKNVINVCAFVWIVCHLATL